MPRKNRNLHDILTRIRNGENGGRTFQKRANKLFKRKMGVIYSDEGITLNTYAIVIHCQSRFQLLGYK